MTRPISIDELVKNDTPRFIKKRDRVSKPEAKLVVKPKKIESVVQSDQLTPEPTIITQNKKPIKTQFNFDWDQSDDTSRGYTPLLELDDFDDTLPPPSVHWSAKSLQEMSESDWRDLKDEFNIITKGTKIHPIRSWGESVLDKSIVNILETSKFADPTPVQRASIPIATHQQDIIGIAETGSGKTLAYVLPLLHYILSIEENYLKYEHIQEFNLNKPLGVILAPTRELANQITTELTRFCSALNLTSVSIIGGHSYEETISAIKDGVHIIVATPGRLVDSLERKIINLSKCYYVIFDEADRMIDMGFEKPLNTIYENLPEINEADRQTFKLDKRITMMFTATFSDSINTMTKKYLIKPVQLVIGQIGEKVDNINQEFEFIQTKYMDTKFEKLVQVINKHARRNKVYSIIVFANYIKTVEELSDSLAEKGYKNITIHGSKSQQARERSIDEFRNGRVRILVATDVAARGIDIANVSLVVNYQMTKRVDEYIHRIGRTGRAGTKGNSYTFIEDGDEPLFPDLRRFLKKNLPAFLVNRNQTIKD
ncbi:mRNA splicing protein prp28 [Yamadazyma tenuis]|uniref:RNA helicase n=1 Tax=Candida tenuis (strain ATCC 10573 / BCRC 21748 / CBS 615 / JCM 9827 / NBRC 10315 / NRRL Y-1498 / VKM Y-70) TaxID=590646 RepID=G3BEJ8_CANTC|nr:P-loop containing nucleoside triphosphate hydrolase protein [Yamadazyma tenuis ATCC 10573]EGV60561.1 P-loop containing nucleoside triphosphate hydrolase protein [Yamadazyma tenuis ATCC 10573]WEJ94196.1 mRNA splicing protein prp28 [Yamadazyma tenuis]